MDQEISEVDKIGLKIERWIDETKSERLNTQLMQEGRLWQRFLVSHVKDHSHLEAFLKARFQPFMYEISHDGTYVLFWLTEASRSKYDYKKIYERGRKLKMRDLSDVQAQPQGAHSSSIPISGKRSSAASQMREQKRIRPEHADDGRQRQLQSDVLPLADVKIYLLALPDDEAVGIQSLVDSCGGGRVTDVRNATHIIVGDNNHLKDIDPWKQVGEFKELRRIVSTDWLNHVMAMSVSPWDDDVSSRFIAPFVRAKFEQKRAIAPQRTTRSMEPTAKWSPSKRPLIARQKATENLSSALRAENVAALAQTAVSDKSSPSHLPSPVEALPEAARSCTGVSSDSTIVKRQMTSSLAETLEFLKREQPDVVEADQLRFAIERSLLDVAVQVYTKSPSSSCKLSHSSESPSEILGVPESAGISEIRAAYRAKALQAHPDKGGDSKEFHRIQKAYLALHEKHGGAKENASPDQSAIPLGTGVAKDFELRNHRELVRQKFQQDGVDLSVCLSKQTEVIRCLQLVECDLGATNRNEKGETIYNQCFYLSLSRSYLGSVTDVLYDVALNLKRHIEASVLAAHADWAGHRVGEDIQAFSDFLFFALSSHALLCELAVAVFDSCSAAVEIYVGRDFPSRSKQAEQRANLLTVLYVPGHYRALVPVGESPRPSLSEVVAALEKSGVHYVMTYV